MRVFIKMTHQILTDGFLSKKQFLTAVADFAKISA